MVFIKTRRQHTGISFVDDKCKSGNEKENERMIKYEQTDAYVSLTIYFFFLEFHRNEETLAARSKFIKKNVCTAEKFATKVSFSLFSV
jgi:hypothetical protein